MLKTAVLNMSCNCQERCVMEFVIKVSDNIKIKVENFAKSRLKNKCFLYRSSHQRCSVKKGVLRDFAKSTGKHLCQGLFFNKGPQACNFIKKETLTQVFSCEFCEISKNIFFTEHLRTTASVFRIV